MIYHLNCLFTDDRCHTRRKIEQITRFGKTIYIQVIDLDIHRRFLSEPIDIIHLPARLREGVLQGVECLYIRVSPASELEYYL